MCHLEVKPKKRVLMAADGSPVYIRLNDRSSWRKVVVPILLISNAIVLIYTIQAPIMQLTAFFMIPETYCIWTFGSSMGEDGYVLFALMTFCFLIIVPLVKLIAIAILWYSKVKLEHLDRYNQAVKALGKWAMLDVFTVGFFVFTKVSYTIVPGVVRLNGADGLIVFSALSYLLDIVT
jgi:uncharacterized paraquat-inducible protein A